MDELVSVIVPVYNARGAVSRCVDSLTGQAYRALQIILVDDGSTDGSGELLDALARGDPRIEVVHQANGGVSAARNAGLDRARGAWIAFVDADDFVSPHYIENLYAISREGCDMAICHYLSVRPGDDSPPPYRRAAKVQYITGREACVRRFGKEIFLFNSCWGKLFRASLWEGLRFPVGMLGEDLFVSHALLYRAGRVAITDAYLYAYVQSEGSLTRCPMTPRCFDALDAWQEGVRFYGEADETELADIARRVYLSRTLDALCICKRHLPHERAVQSRLRQRALEAYRAANSMRGFIDCSRRKALGYRMKFFVGRWCPALYDLIFVRGRVSL